MSNVKDNGQNHRVALDFLEDEAVQFILDAVLERRPVLARQRRLRQNLPHDIARVLNNILILADVDEAAADDIRAGDKALVVAVNRHDDVLIAGGCENFVDEVRVFEISDRISHLDYIRIAQPWKFHLCVDPYVADVLCVFLYGSEGDSEFEIVRI